jgi:outer membrane receptor protein involved in Fe transport
MFSTRIATWRSAAIIAATTCLCLASSATLHAADTELDEVIITASRSAMTLAQMPLHTTVISAAELAASPARTLDQVLRNIPGLNFSGVPTTQSDPTGHQTRMRGLGNAKVLVLLDGVPVHDPFYLTTQWYKLPLSRIEHIEVLRGGYSSLWGNMAVAGVVNVVTRRVDADSVDAVLGAGSRGTKSAALTGDLLLGNGVGLRLYADQNRVPGYQVTPAEYLWRFPQKDTAAARNSNVGATLQFGSEESLSGFVRAGYHVQDQDISYVYGSNEQKSPDIAGGLKRRFANGSTADVHVWSQYVGFEKYNGASCWFQASGTRCPNSNTVTPAQVNGNVLQYYTQYGSLKYRELGGSAGYSLPIGGVVRELQVGTDVRRLSATDRETFYSAPTNASLPQGNLGSRTFGAGTQLFAGAYAQARLAPVDSLELTLAARLDTWKNTDRNFTRTTAAGITTGGDIADSSRHQIDPSLGLRWTLNDELSVRGGAYRSFRAPGFNNTLRTFGATTPTIANPDLGPETLRGWELGTDWRGESLTLGATYFRYVIHDQIATFRVNSYATAPGLVRTICAANGGANLTNCGGSANFYTNDQDSQSHGLELSAEWSPLRALRIGADYTRTVSTLTRRGAIVTDPLDVQLVGLPRDIATLRVNWQPLAALQLQAQGRYIGPMLIDTTSVAGTTFGQGSATVFDASASWAFNARWGIAASVVNALDRRYSEGGYTYNQPWNRTLSQPRSFNAELRLRF